MGERERDKDRKGGERWKIWREESVVKWQYHSALEAMCLTLRQNRLFLLLCKVLQEPYECFFQVHCFFITSPAGGVLAAVSLPSFFPSHSLHSYPLPHPPTHLHTHTHTHTHTHPPLPRPKVVRLKPHFIFTTVIACSYAAKWEKRWEGCWENLEA